MGSAFVLQIAERIEEDTHKMTWRTVVVFSYMFPDDATVMQAECTVAVEAASAICHLARTGCICFDLDGNLIEDNNKTRQGEGTK